VVIAALCALLVLVPRVSLEDLVLRARPSILPAQAADWVNRLIEHFPIQINTATKVRDGVGMIRDLFERYDQFPRSNTIRAFREHGIALGEPLQGCSTTAVLYRCQKGAEPRILKKLDSEQVRGYQAMHDVVSAEEQLFLDHRLAPFDLVRGAASQSASMVRTRDWASMPHYPTDLSHCAKPLAPIDADTLIEQMMRALEFLHAHQLAHMDVKPSNIFVAQQGGFWLADFDTVCSYRSGAACGPSLSTTPEFVPREFKTAHRVCAQHDWWMLAMTVIDMITPPMGRGMPAGARDSNCASVRKALEKLGTEQASLLLRKLQNPDAIPDRRGSLTEGFCIHINCACCRPSIQGFYGHESFAGQFCSYAVAPDGDGRCKNCK
jgi:hypothetical protein